MKKRMHIITIVFPLLCGISCGQNNTETKDGETRVPLEGMQNLTQHIYLPADVESGSAELRTLRERALSAQVEEQEDARGKLLSYIAPGIPKENVELWLGKGAQEYPASVTGGDAEQIISTYYCRLPGQEGTHLMTIHYEKQGKILVVVGVKGPHFPDN